MDLILLASPNYRQRDLGLRSCLRGIDKSIKIDRLFYAGELRPEWCSDEVRQLRVPEYDQSASEIVRLKQLFLAAPDLSDQVFVMDDHTFLRSLFFGDDICIVNASALKRDAKNTELMVHTINYLLNDERDTCDYETGLPVVIDKELLLKLADRVRSRPVLLRTTYLNIFKQPHVLQVKGTVLEQWSQDLKPTVPWLNLDDVALEHPQCQKWLRKNFDEKCRFEK